MYYRKEKGMNCRFHPESEAVTKCAVCGADLCSSCDTNAFFRVKEGALCLKCSQERALNGITWKTEYLKGLKRKLIFATIFIVLSIIIFILSSSTAGYIFGAIFWFLSGFIQTRGQEKDAYSVKNMIWGDKEPDEDESTFRFIAKVIFYVLAAPIMLIRNIIDYFGTRGMKKSDIQEYEKISSALNDSNKQNFEWWKKVAEDESYSGRNDALAILAGFYYDGEGVEQDKDKAIELLKESAELSSAVGQFGLGDCYFHGDGINQDYGKAIDLWQKAAEQNHVEAQFNLGLCYYEGSGGVTKDFATAAKWWEKAAVQGFADAQRDLGLCYEEGKGVVQNHEKAVELWTKAAEQGDEKAMQCLQQYSE